MPKEITSGGGDHTCAIDDEGVKCWGRNNLGQTSVPTTLKNPRAVSAGAKRRLTSPRAGRAQANSNSKVT